MRNDFKNFPLFAVISRKTKVGGVHSGGIMDCRIDDGVITLECAQKVGMCTVEFVDIELTPDTAAWEWQDDDIVITFMQPADGVAPPAMTIVNVNRPFVENL